MLNTGFGLEVPRICSGPIVAVMDFEPLIRATAFTFSIAISQDSRPFGQPLWIPEFLVIGSFGFK